MFLIGLANSLVDINAYTIIQRIAPAEVMGRVFGALESIVIAGMALGSLLMPLLIGRSGCAAGWSSSAPPSPARPRRDAGLRRIDTAALAPPGLALLRGVPTLARAAATRTRAARPRRSCRGRSRR